MNASVCTYSTVVKLAKIIICQIVVFEMYHTNITCYGKSFVLNLHRHCGYVLEKKVIKYYVLFTTLNCFAVFLRDVSFNSLTLLLVYMYICVDST